MCICFIRCGIKVTLFTIHMQTPKAYFIYALLSKYTYTASYSFNYLVHHPFSR